MTNSGNRCFTPLYGVSSMSQIKPMFDRVLVKRLDSETTTPGGIIIPDTAQDKTQSGHVVAVGTGKLLTDGQIRPLSVKPGSKVLFGKYSGTEVSVNGEDFIILREDELLAEMNDNAVSEISVMAQGRGTKSASCC